MKNMKKTRNMQIIVKISAKKKKANKEGVVEPIRECMEKGSIE